MDVILQWFRRTFSNPQIVILCALLLSGPVFLHFFGSMLAPALAAVAIAYLLDGNVLAPLLLSGVTKLHPVWRSSSPFSFSAASGASGACSLPFP